MHPDSTYQKGIETFSIIWKQRRYSETVEKLIYGKFESRLKRIVRKIIYKIIPTSIFFLHGIHLPQYCPFRQIHNS